MVSIRCVVDPSDDELERVLNALHESFNYKYFYSRLGSTELSKELLRSHIVSALLEPAGEVWVAELDDASREVVGVAVWFGPGAKYLRTEEQREAGWNQLYAKLDKRYQEWWDYFWALYDAYTERVLGPGSKLNGYHLQALGVLHKHRRQGIATKLFQVVEEKAKERGVCTCEETVGTSAVPIYKSLGYEVKDPVPLKVLSDDPDATAPLYAFVKFF